MTFGIKSIGTIPLGTQYVGVTYAVAKTLDVSWSTNAYVVKQFDVAWVASAQYVVKAFDTSWAVTSGISLNFDITWQTSSYVMKPLNTYWTVAYQQEIETNNAFKVAPVNRVYSPACLYSNKSPCDKDN